MGRGGDGGKIIIVAKEIKGDGEFIADGGDGSVGGKGGEIHLYSEQNAFTGETSVRGGQSSPKSAKPWWEQTPIQIIMLLGAIAGIMGLIWLFR